MGDQLVLSEHAIHRYRQRINRAATDEQIQQQLNQGRRRNTAPGDLGLVGPAEAWIVAEHGAVFALERLSPSRLIAVTTLKRHRPCKADRRLMRECARDEAEGMAA